MPQEEEFPDWVYKNRRELGLSQAALAHHLGVAQGAVSSWETGRSYPKAAMIVKLEDLFNHGLSATEIELLPCRSDEPVTEVPVDTNTRYGEWMQKTRISKKLSVADLAEVSGVTPATIYNIESGRIQNPQQVTKDKISSGLKVILPETVRAEVLEENSAGEFGEMVDFDPHDVNAEIGFGGVYVLYDVSGRPVYVGIAANIAIRMAQHRRDKVWFASQRIIFRGRYVAISIESRRRSLEKLMIKFLGDSAVFNIHHRSPLDSL